MELLKEYKAAGRVDFSCRSPVRTRNRARNQLCTRRRSYEPSVVVNRKRLQPRHDGNISTSPIHKASPTRKLRRKEESISSDFTLPPTPPLSTNSLVSSDSGMSSDSGLQVVQSDQRMGLNVVSVEQEQPLLNLLVHGEMSSGKKGCEKTCCRSNIQLVQVFSKECVVEKQSEKKDQSNHRTGADETANENTGCVQSKENVGVEGIDRPVSTPCAEMNNSVGGRELCRRRLFASPRPKTPRFDKNCSTLLVAKTSKKTSQKKSRSNPRDVMKSNEGTVFGARLQRCKYCSPSKTKRFRTVGHLTLHIRSVHGFICPLCDKSVGKKSSFDAFVHWKTCCVPEAQMRESLRTGKTAYYLSEKQASVLYRVLCLANGNQRVSRGGRFPEAHLSSLLYSLMLDNEQVKKRLLCLSRRHLVFEKDYHRREVEVTLDESDKWPDTLLDDSPRREPPPAEFCSQDSDFSPRDPDSEPDFSPPQVATEAPAYDMWNASSVQTSPAVMVADRMVGGGDDVMVIDEAGAWPRDLWGCEPTIQGFNNLINVTAEDYLDANWNDIQEKLLFDFESLTINQSDRCVQLVYVSVNID